MNLKSNFLFVSAFLIVMTCFCYGQDKQRVETLSLEQVKERINQGYKNKQRITVKYRVTDGGVERIYKVSGKITKVDSDHFTLSGDGLLGSDTVEFVRYSYVISIKKQNSGLRIGSIIGRNALIAPLVPAVLILTLVGGSRFSC